MLIHSFVNICSRSHNATEVWCIFFISKENVFSLLDLVLVENANVKLIIALIEISFISPHLRRECYILIKCKINLSRTGIKRKIIDYIPGNGATRILKNLL